MNLLGLRQSVHTWRKRAPFLFCLTSGVYINIFSIEFGVSVREYICQRNMQVMDISYLDARGQSASYCGQQLTKIVLRLGGGV